mmetsp:Transcript_9117/g.27371  ORF Transcript_9117/g.27371 Transcript_9117/m.27371 type:complete len:325 (+) Transcript_9117:520-1494(+)
MPCMSQICEALSTPGGMLSMAWSAPTSSWSAPCAPGSIWFFMHMYTMGCLCESAPTTRLSHACAKRREARRSWLASIHRSACIYFSEHFCTSASYFFNNLLQNAASPCSFAKSLKPARGCPGARRSVIWRTFSAMATCPDTPGRPPRAKTRWSVAIAGGSAGPSPWPARPSPRLGEGPRGTSAPAARPPPREKTRWSAAASCGGASEGLDDTMVDRPFFASAAATACNCRAKRAAPSARGRGAAGGGGPPGDSSELELQPSGVAPLPPSGAALGSARCPRRGGVGTASASACAEEWAENVAAFARRFTPGATSPSGPGVGLGVP